MEEMEWNMEENFRMEWNMEENFSMEWNMEWKILVGNGNGMEENCQYGIWKYRLPFHSIPCPALQLQAEHRALSLTDHSSTTFQNISVK